MTQAVDAYPSLETPFLIVIGASAGGVEAIAQLIQALPPNLPAAILAVIHFPAYSKSVLPQILNRRGQWPASQAKDGAAILPGQIYTASPDYHLVVQQGYVSLNHGPQENGHRPAIDVLFRSAAKAYGSRTIGVVLSGTLDDGTVGLKIIKSQGGIAIAQDPNEALFNSMPRSAIENVAVDYVLPIAGIASILSKLVASHPLEKMMTPEHTKIEQDAAVVAEDKAALERGEYSGRSSTITCPGCGGVLWELHNDSLVRFRCHIGHAYSLDSLVSEQADMVEQALWSAVRALEEKAALARRMEAHNRRQYNDLSANQFSNRAHEAENNATLLRQILLNNSNKQELT